MCVKFNMLLAFAVGPKNLIQADDTCPKSETQKLKTRKPQDPVQRQGRGRKPIWKGIN